MTKRASKRLCFICHNEFQNSHIKTTTCSLKCGVQLKRLNIISRIESVINEPIDHYINRKMNDGASQNEIMKDFNIANRTMMWIMEMYNIKPRNRSDAVKLQWKDNEQRRKSIGKLFTDWSKKNPVKSKERSNKANLKQQNSKDPTSIELRMMHYLERNGILYTFQHVVNNKFICDFLINNTNIIVECDGDYWHGKEDQKKKDYSKNRYLETCGYIVLRFSETRINQDIESCINDINYHRATIQ